MNTYVYPQRIVSLLLLLALFVCLTPSLSAAAPQCKVTSNLNLRSTPGTATNNKLGSLAPNATFEPLAVQLDAAKQPWFQVKLTSAGVGVNSGTTGWVIANTKWITCTPIVKTLVTTLPAAKGTAPAPPPPKKVAYTDLPNGGVGNEDNIDGKLRIFDARESADGDGTYIFQNQMLMRLEASYNNQPNGQGLRSVRFRIIDYNDPEHPVYEQTEENYPFCLFGNQTSECEVIWDFAATNYRWPKTNRPIDPNTTYSAVVRAQASEGGNVSWDFEFRIQPPGFSNTPPESAPAQPLQLALAQTVLGSADTFVTNGLAFEVVAFDPNVGSNNGDGIQSVDLWITGPNGEVHRRTEKTPGYCAFGGGEPTCNVYDFNEQGYTWPNGEAIISGASYTLHARVNAQSGQQTEQAWFVTIQ